MLVTKKNIRPLGLVCTIFLCNQSFEIVFNIIIYSYIFPVWSHLLGFKKMLKTCLFAILVVLFKTWFFLDEKLSSRRMKKKKKIGGKRKIPRRGRERPIEKPHIISHFLPNKEMKWGFKENSDFIAHYFEFFGF